MPSTYTGSLRLEQIADGEQAATWGDTVNRTLGLIDAAICGIAQIVTGGGTVTLSANNGAADQSRPAILLLQGALSSPLTIVIPAVPKLLLICNQLTGTFAVTLQVEGGGATGLPVGAGGVLFCDGAGVNLLSPISLFNSVQVQGSFLAGSAVDPIGSGVAGTSITAGIAEISAPIGSTPLALSSQSIPGNPNTGHLLGLYGGSSASPVGSISTDGASSYYNTTSDVRLKDKLRRLPGALARVARLRVYRGVFRSAPDRELDMMLAHEVGRVVPEAVTGKRNAVDKAGRPIPQTVDYSKLVPLLAAGLIEAEARIARLERR